MYFLVPLTLFSTLLLCVGGWSDNGCSFSYSDDYEIKWRISNSTIHFTIEYSNSVNDSFWIGIGFSNVENSRNDIADLVAFIVNSDNVTAVVTQLQDRNEVQFADLDSANVTILGTANINIEDSDKYQFNFSRRLAPSETFSSDLSNCSIWTLYTEAQSLTNTSRNSLDFLICSLSRMCEDNSIENESGNETSQEDGHHNETTEEDAHQNQTAEENEQQQNQKNQQTGSSQEGNVEGHQSGQENKENETNHSSHKKCHNKSKRQIQEVTANAVVPEIRKLF